MVRMAAATATRAIGTRTVTVVRDDTTGRTVYADAKTGRRLRDYVTGEPIYTDTQHILRIRTARVDFVPPKRDLADDLHLDGIQTTPIPTQINTAQPDPDGRLGGRKWHPELTRYLGNHTTKAVADGDRALRGAWWTGQDAVYALERVRRGFVAHYRSEERGTQAMNVALAILRDGEDYHVVAAQFGGHTVSWVDHQCRLAYRFAYQKATATA